MGPVIRNVIRDVIRPVMGDEALVSRFSPAARDYFNRLDAAGLRVGTYDAANAALIDRLVGNGGNFWPDSGAFCAMAGYLYPGNGANLIPLKDGHDAGTLNASVTGDWNAVTGLKGDGSTKYVDSNRNNNADGRDDQAMGFYQNSTPTVDTRTIGGNSDTYASGDTVLGFTQLQMFARNRNESGLVNLGAKATGYVGMTRSEAASFLTRISQTSTSQTQTSQTPSATKIRVFAGGDTATPVAPTNARLPFYHIGPNLNGAGELAELDAALTEWKNALASA